MKDEIKEILDNIKNKYEDYYVQDIVSGNDLKALLDYITNLQEENERYKIAYENVMIANKMLDEKYKDYKTRNEKAIEKLKYYSGGEADYYVPFEVIINLLQGKSDE